MEQDDPVVLVALGANLPGPAGPPAATLTAALDRLEARGITVRARSRWYASAAWPPSAQPDYVNGVARVATGLSPQALLAEMHAVEAELGRRRGVPNAARTVDLDLLAYGERVIDTPALVLPHPRLADRAFVLQPLAEVAPDWRDPRTGLSVAALIARLPDPDAARPIEPT